MTDNFDKILTKLGTGKWQMLYYIPLGYLFGCIAFQSLGSAFLAPDTSHTCIVPSGGKSVLSLSLLESGALDEANDTSNGTYRTEEASGSQCAYKIENNITGALEEEKCSSWEYDNSSFILTATSEFNLVCESRMLQATFQSIYMFGILFGSVLSGFLSDRHGRYVIMIVGAFLFALIGSILPWLPTISLVLAARFLLGVTQPMALISGYVIAMEITSPNMRKAVGISIFIGWSFGTIILGGIGYLIRDWRWLQLTLSLPCFLFLPSCWIMDESPRWLVVNGKFDKAMKILQKGAKWNKTDLGSEKEMLTVMTAVYKEREDEESTVISSSLSKEASAWLKEATILFRTPKLRKITLILCWDFFVVSMIYFGLSLAGGSFEVDQFAFLAISGLMEVPAHTVAIPIVLKCGSRLSLVLSYIITGVCMLILPFVPADYNWFAVTVSMIGKMTITTVFQIVGLYANELFPTEVRNRGIGTCMMTSRLGSIVSPYLQGMFGVSMPWVTPVVFGLTSLSSGLLSMLLQETKDADLPDTIRHLEGYDNPAM